MLRPCDIQPISETPQGREPVNPTGMTTFEIDELMVQLAPAADRSLRKTGQRLHAICKLELWPREVQTLPAPSCIV